MPGSEHQVAAAAKQPAFRFTESDTAFEVQGTGFALAVSKRTGALQSYQIDSRELLTAPLEPNFWKVPNDNQHRNGYLNRLGPWRSAAAARHINGVTATRLTSGAVRIRVDATLPVGSSAYGIDYTVAHDGRVTVAVQYTPGQKQLPLIPKFGMTMALPPGFQQVQWYGRGPQETYWDRKTGGEIGIYKGAVEELIHPYVRAQDTGNRSDVRWVSFTNAAGFGIRVTAKGAPLNFSAWPFTAADLEGASHDADLPRRDFITINIDHQLHGVGGDNSWGARTHPEYTLPGGKAYSYAFTLSPRRSPQ